eukprot:TRINITY_DN14401_c0_g1_i3.p1 TRINITY_DN14401_c0_g1~~TRINITY_DN14401_c0_g1_i3.p1  ORF type:complete len:155 (-),score=16.96 TRINITY_DN14401_c0_g1_i3:217-681(-)
MQLRADVDHQCGVLYRSWKYELHGHYLELLEQGVPRPQDHPAEGCGLADWQLMISQCWESPAWKAKSKKAQESRAKLPYNHTSGSRSFASRMSLMVGVGLVIIQQFGGINGVGFYASETFVSAGPVPVIVFEEEPKEAVGEPQRLVEWQADNVI